jgi:hypothetical protein
VNANTNISRTHESFFPKIKSTFEIEETDSCEDKFIMTKKFNSNNVITNNGKIVTNKLTNEGSYSHSPEVRLEEGISFGVIKENKTNVALKKFLHVKSFDVYKIEVRLYKINILFYRKFQ